MGRVLLIGCVTLAMGCGLFVQKKDPLIVAARKSDLPTAKRLVEGGADVNRLGKSGTYPLLQAVGRSEEMVRYLLSKGATPNRPKGGFNAPICVALLADNPKFSAPLIEAGAKLDIVCHNRLTPLGYVAGNGEQGQILQLLMGNASIDFRDKSGYTPLKIAASTKRAAIMRLLLSRGASPLELSWTELMPAIGTGADLWKRFEAIMPHSREPSIAQLQKVRAEVSAHAAAQFVEIRSRPSHPLNLALKAGKSPNEVDKNGVTALEAAWRAHQPAVAAILLASGARGAAQEASKVTADYKRITASKYEDILEIISADPLLAPTVVAASKCRLSIGDIVGTYYADCLAREETRRELGLKGTPKDRGRTSAIDILKDDRPPNLGRAAAFYTLSREMTLLMFTKFAKAGNDPTRLR